MRLDKIIKMLALFMCLVLTMPGKLVEAKTSNTKGIDVSGKYNGVVDWDAVAKQGYTFAMIRIAEGQAPDVDLQFEANYEGAKAAGLKVGVYHDCCIRTPEAAVLEANYCLELLNGRPLDYPVAYDIEKPGSFAGGTENTTNIAKSYCNVIKEAGYTPMIYSTANHLSNDFNWDELEGIKIWVAHYEVAEPAFTHSYDLWQYTNKGFVEGANNDKENCDLNYSFWDAESIAFPEEEITLGLGESIRLNPKFTPSGCTDSITWSSSDELIATVDSNGKVLTKNKGTIIITATSGSGVSAATTITIKNAPKIVTLKNKSKKLVVGETYQLKPILPSGSASNQITYQSNNKKVAIVSNSGKIKAKHPGTATISIFTYNRKRTTFKIFVKA